MKAIYVMSSAVIALTGFTACNNMGADAAKKDADNVSMYVDSVNNLTPVYTVENWAAINNGYQERAMQAEKTTATLEASDKAKLEESKDKYAKLKAAYETELKKNEAAAAVIAATPDYRMTLRNKLFGEGKIGTDMKFDYVTGANILSVYKNFVNTVADNKKSYTREDWDEIKVLYEALDTRKNVVEKDLSTGDNLKIAGLKIRFASILDTHRAGTKVNENADAKQ